MHLNRRDILRTAAMMAVAPTTWSQPGTADLAGDIDILRRALELHPGVHRYSTPDQVAQRIDLLAQAFTAAPSTEARYLALSHFMATLRCGHSWCNFSNQRRAVATDLFDRPTRVPFHFTWIGDRMIVTRDPQGVGLPPGTEVHAINGVAVSEVLRKLLPLARADGANDAKRVALLGVSGTDRFESFDIFHGLVFGVPPSREHLLVVTRPSQAQSRVTVPALDLTQRRAQMATPPSAPDAPAWTWAMRPDGVALLTMPTWALYRSKWDWAAWLADRLDSLDAGAKGLVIDLRDNEGGLDCGDAVFARLATTPLQPPAIERRVRFTRTPKDLDPYLDTWDDSFRTLGEKAAPAGDGFLRLPADADDMTIAPKGKRVRVPVAALVGPTNSSATFQFAQLARQTKLVRLFGTPTGGNQRGINGGRYFFVRLPASGLEFDLPLIGYFPTEPRPDAGIEPDVLVARTAADWATGADPALDRAVRWCLAG